MSHDEPTGQSDPGTPPPRPPEPPATHVGPRFEPAAAPTERVPVVEREKQPLAPIGGFVAPRGPGPTGPKVPPPRVLHPNEPPTTPPALAPDRRDRRKLPKWVAMIPLVLIAAGVVWGATLISKPPSTEERYLEELRSITLDEEFSSDAEAVANAERVCAELEAGGRPRGFEEDFIGVKYYCEQYVQLFEVIDTPEDQETVLLTRLEAADVLDTFPSEAAAIERAKELCDAFKDGSKQTGDQADQIAVEVYCPVHLADFTLNETTVVLGTFTLKAPLGQHDPMITTSQNFCEGTGIYADYHEGTKVDVRNGDDEVLASGFLSKGSGSPVECVFTFSMEITEGEDTYLFTVDDRDQREFTFIDIKEGRVKIELGG